MDTQPHRQIVRVTGVVIALLAVALAQSATARDLGRETLPANDGWGADPPTTTGGAAADAQHVFVVDDRQQLIAALAFPDATPKIVYVRGRIEANVDDNGQPLQCSDYATTDPQGSELYDRNAYLSAYDPATWGTSTLPSGPQERARAASQLKQQARVRIRIGANTTIVGLGSDAEIHGGWFDIRPSTGEATAAMNVIVRNLNFRDVFDCFPQWDPTDGSSGNWNSAYDAISIQHAAHVWVDHNRLRDDATADANEPHYFGRLYQIHDGLLDITNQADQITGSWNRFAQHDKVSLFGSSDSATADAGKLRITLHHNWYDDVVERGPRVRYGQVHIYNNYYSIPDATVFQYSWGVGKSSAIYADSNVFDTAAGVQASALIKAFKGTAIYAQNSLVNGTTSDLVASYNAANSTPLSTDVGWTPQLHLTIAAPADVAAAVLACAGPLADSDTPDGILRDGFEVACTEP
jgi:pectate lyase